jgi:ribose 5-phosphate isomerase B
MRVALCSDEPYAVHDTIARVLRERGHEVCPFGACASKTDVPWAEAAEEAALAVAEGRADEGIFLCWTGTGISMAANKVAGIRAALVFDPGGAAGARIWNHANVLCLSNRLLSDDMAKEILAAWFDTPPGERGVEGVRHLEELDRRYRARKA